MTTIFLVSCVSAKHTTPHKAKDMYISTWFKKARRYIEHIGYEWFILSAKYGLLNPEEVINPYNETLNKMSIGARKDWANKVRGQLETEALIGVSHIVFFAGIRYREFLISRLSKKGITCRVPMEGLAIGKQLQWLSRSHTLEG